MAVIGSARSGSSGHGRSAMWLALAALLALPWMAMHFTAEVNWDGADFAAAAVLFGGVGLAVEAACRMVAGPLARGAAVAIAILAGGVIWAQAAIGVF
ncbi:MAG: hypothetical protein ABW203_05865 [Novosphingobium sp.]